MLRNISFLVSQFTVEESSPIWEIHPETQFITTIDNVHPTRGNNSVNSSLIEFKHYHLRTLTTNLQEK